MRDAILLIALSAAFSASALAAPKVAIQSTLTTGFVEELKKRIEIHPLNDGSNKWVIETRIPCSTYPCDEESRTTSRTITPEVIGTDARAADGCLTVKLTDELSLSECNGFHSPGSEPVSPYTLIVNKAGQEPASFPLFMQSRIEVIR